MTKIKFCGLKRPCDIEFVNLLQPEYIGFVFAPKSKRYVSPEEAARLRAQLSGRITPVGVFVNEPPEAVAALLARGVIEIAQLHGGEDETYLQALRKRTDRPVIKAFRIASEADIEAARRCTADFVLLDSGSGGTGTAFDWTLIRDIGRSYFLAGGLDAGNVREAVARYQPYAVDVSSGIETDGGKSKAKMEAFIRAVRSAQE